MENGSANSAYDIWLDKRDAHLQFMFGNAIEVATTTNCPRDTANTNSLATLAIGTELKGAGRFERHDEQQITESVQAILAYHDRLAHGSKGGIFSFLNPEKDLDCIAAMTAQVVTRWDRAWNRHNKRNGVSSEDSPSPFAELPVDYIEPADFERTDVQLVVETAAAVGEILRMGYTFGNPGSSRHKQVANFITKHGPAYATDWANGKLIREECVRRKTDPARWLGILHKSMLLDFLIHYQKNPMDAMERLANCYHDTLSLTNLVAITGLSVQKTEESFSNNVRKKLAVQYFAGDVEHAVRSTMTLLATSLSTKELAARLGWTEERVDEMFAPSERMIAAITSPGNPQARLERAAKGLDDPTLQTTALAKMLGWSNSETKALFTTAVIRDIASNKETPLLDNVRRIARNYETVLSTRKLSQALAQYGIKETQIKLLFTASIRKRFAKLHDPISAAADVVRLYTNLTREYATLSPSLIADLARSRSPGIARDIAEQIKTELPTCPRGISPSAWAWTIANNPRATREKWLLLATTYYSTPSQRRMKWLNASVSVIDDRPFHEYRRTPGDTALEPSEMLLPNDSLELLQSLASKAGINQGDLEALLEHLSQTGDVMATERNSKLGPILQRLRNAGKS